MTDSRTGQLLGAVGLVAVDAESGVAEVGYWVAPGCRGRGVAAAAVTALASWALDDGGLARLELLVEPDNLASRRSAERAGAVLEGVLRSKGTTRDGGRCDFALYALVREVPRRRVSPSSL